MSRQLVADPAQFRAAMRHVPTPVAIVATIVRGAPVGLAVGSFTSVSLRPALVTFFVDCNSSTWPLMNSSDTFTVNFLGHQHAEQCQVFTQKGADRFGGVGWTPSATGDPVLDDAAVVLQCHNTAAAGWAITARSWVSWSTCKCDAPISRSSFTKVRS
jgi:3-hydroxy-9,10-secoandrosta-1,3,5(10)-triene-9,17-dione monooxygenase reductase component